MRAALLAAGILGGAIPALAQTLAPPYQESIVVSASLEEEEREELPASVTVIAAGEIEERRATEVLELLATVPGLDVVQSGSRGKVASVFTRGANSNQTLVLWNGVQLNDPFFGGFDWAFLSTDGVERIEVVRGPFSALHGSEAVGGVVQIIPRRGDGGSLRLEGGGDGYLRGGLSRGLTIGSLRIDASGHARRGDGQVDNDFYDGEELATAAEWRLGSGVTLGVVARASDAEVGLPFDFLGQPSPRRVQDRRTQQLALPFSWEREDWRLEVQLAEHRVEVELRDPDQPLAGSDSEAEAKSARAVATYRADDRTWIGFGADWERQEARSASAFGPGLDGESQRTWAAFSELHHRRGRWSFDLGLRRDDNDAFGGETTMRAGALYRVSDGVRLWASYGEGFRAPSLGDLFFPGFGNPDLRPELSESVEAGVEIRRAAGPGVWELGLVGFETDQENLIVFDFLTSAPMNVGRARSRGVEAEAGLRLASGWIRWNATYLQARDLDGGGRLIRRPRWSSNLVASWRRGDWQLSAEGRYVGDRLDSGGVVLPSYTTFQLAGAWRASERLEPYARLENALDRSYEEAAGFPAPGRALVVGLAVEF